MTSLHIIYASTSGHTEYVVDQLVACIQKSRPNGSALRVTTLRAELAQANDLLANDLLILATSSWNTGGPEGQLNPHMFALLMNRAADVDLKGKRVAVIGLGDDRYHFLCAAADHLEEFVRSHNGQLITPTLRMINEPYGQEKKISSWALSAFPDIA